MKEQVTPLDVLTAAVELFKAKNAEYTKGNPHNVYDGFLLSKRIQDLANYEEVSLPKALWNLVSKHLANISAFLCKKQIWKKDLESANASAVDIVVYFAILASMLQNQIRERNYIDKS